MAKTKPQPEPQSRFRDRIRELRRIRVGDLTPHSGNCRRHPGKQMAALCGVLTERGKCGVLYAYPSDGKGPDGDFSKLTLYDGHLRQSIDPNEVWPVAVTDLRAEEVPLVLGTFDPIGGMADTDPVAFDAILRNVNTGCAELQQLLDDVWENAQADAIAGTEDGDGAADEPEDDPPADDDLTIDPTEQSDKLKGFIERREKSRARANDAHELHYWCCLVFQSWAQKKEFIDQLKCPTLYGLYIHGERFAEEVGRPVTPNAQAVIRTSLDAKLAALVLSADESKGVTNGQNEGQEHDQAGAGQE